MMYDKWIKAQDEGVKKYHYMFIYYIYVGSNVWRSLTVNINLLYICCTGSLLESDRYSTDRFSKSRNATPAMPAQPTENHPTFVRTANRDYEKLLLHVCSRASNFLYTSPSMLLCDATM